MIKALNINRSNHNIVIYLKLYLENVAKVRSFWIDINGINETIDSATELNSIEENGKHYTVFEKTGLEQGSLQMLQIKGIFHHQKSHLNER